MVAITVGKDPCYFQKEFFKIKDLRFLFNIKLCAGAVRGCHLFLLTIRLKLKSSSSWLAYIQAQVTSTSTLPEYCETPEYFKPKFKCMERKVGKEIEQVAEESCKKWKEVN